MSCVLKETVFGERLNEQMSLSDAIDLLSDLDLINIGELGEKAVSIQTGISQCVKNTPNIDLLNGIQIKTAQTNPDNPTKGFLKAWFTIKNCTAPIAVIVTERVTKKQYFFYIPYSGYKHIITTSTITIIIEITMVLLSISAVGFRRAISYMESEN